jgi:plastocyanin
VRRTLLALAGLAGFGLAVVPAVGSNQSIQTGPGTAFSPPEVTVDVGETVTISNAFGNDHDLQWDDRGSPEPVVRGTAWSSDRTFGSAGDYRFFCTVHGGPGGSGMSGIVHVVAPGGTTTQAQPATTTQTQTQTGTTSTTPTTDTGPTTTTTTTAPSQSTATARDTRAPALRARNGSLRRRIQLAFSVSERARIVARIRGAGLRTTVRFVLVPGNRMRTILRHVKPGRYTISLTATDEAGNRTGTLRKVVRVRGH